MNNPVAIPETSSKIRLLALSILFDAIGMLSFTIPFLGEFSDVVWAPLACFLMTRMYKGTLGKVGGILAFVEEVLPFSDFVPTFTLAWLYKYVIKKENV